MQAIVPITIRNKIVSELDLKRITEHIYALGFPSSLEFRGSDGHEADALQMSSEGDSEIRLELEQPNTGGPCEPFQNESVVFDGKPTRIKIETTTEEIKQNLVDIFYNLHPVSVYPLLVRNGQLISEYPLGVGKREEKPIDQNWYCIELEAEVTGVDILNFYGEGLRQTLLSISGPLELHTSPYRGDSVDEPERLAVIQRGEDRIARYVIEPKEPKNIDEWTV